MSQALLAQGREVVGIDNLNAYYDPALKQARLDRLRAHSAFTFQRLNLTDEPGMRALFQQHGFRRVVHLAAQAGVRYSIEAPQEYVASNVAGFTAILECCAYNNVKHLVYASSSSVYGDSERASFPLDDAADRPKSVYAATKRAGELLAYAYARIHGLANTGIRYFTVYGPWGRPDMAPMIFARQLLDGKPLEVFGDGRQRRAFTFIDDVVRGTLAILDGAPSSRVPPAVLYNLGSLKGVELLEFIRVLAEQLGCRTEIRFAPEPPGEMRATLPDMSAMQRDFGFEPRVSLQEGLEKLARWFRQYYGYGRRDGRRTS